MPTTANYSWPTPADTDLVKDGAEAIRDLGNAIDSTVFANSPGLVHINTTSFSAVASVSINDVFSATYDSYMIKAAITGSVSSNANIRFRVGGVDASGANYQSQYIVGSGTSVSGARATTDTSAVDMILSNVTTTNYARVVEIHNPFKTVVTTWFNAGPSDSGGSIAFIQYGGVHTLTTSYTGFTALAQSGNITGSISVFGYKR